jgi:hypothetical protein
VEKHGPYISIHYSSSLISVGRHSRTLQDLFPLQDRRVWRSWPTLQPSSTRLAYRSYVSAAYVSYVSTACCLFALLTFARTRCKLVVAIVHVACVPLLRSHRLLLVPIHGPLLVRIHGPLLVRFAGLRVYALQAIDSYHPHHPPL